MCGESGRNDPPSRPKPARPSLKSVVTRQQMRRVELAAAMDAVNRRNLREVGESHFVGMSRKERRKLARAYAAGARRAARQSNEAAA